LNDEGDIDYYPFGMEMDIETTQVGTSNDYTYNGKEMNADFGLNLSDYGARWYDASIGRWHSVDPLAELYDSYSPYNYVANNPIRNIDPDGMKIIDETKTETSDGVLASYQDDLSLKKRKAQKSLNNLDKLKGVMNSGSYAAVSAFLNGTVAGIEEIEQELVELEKSDVVYVINETSMDEMKGGVMGYAKYNENDTYDEYNKGGNSGYVQITIGDSYKNEITLSHELKHAYQYNVGELDFARGNADYGLLYDIQDEYDAFQREQFVYGGVYGSGSQTVKQIQDSYPKIAARTTQRRLSDRSGPITRRDKLIEMNQKSMKKHNAPASRYKGWREDL
jgi:RHS repeat-associated protein